MGNYDNTQAANGQALQKAANVQAIFPNRQATKNDSTWTASRQLSQKEKRKGNCYNTLDRDMQMCH